MKVIFNLFSNQITGLDRECMPSEQYIYCPFSFDLQKTLSEPTGNKVQKVNENGEALYFKLIEVSGYSENYLQSSIEETTESRVATKFETQTNTYKIVVSTTTETDAEGNLVEIPVYEEISTVSQVPVEWVDYEKVMIDEVKDRVYKFDENPYMFTYDEVIASKEKSISDNKETTLTFFTCFDEKMEFINTENSSGIDTGNGFVSVQPGGVIQTNPITLNNPSHIIEIYSEKQTSDSFNISVSADGTNFIDVNELKQVLFESDVTSVVVRFTNNNASRRELYAYGVLI